jgi:ribose/xylose/arabinose/galactoside ABC-type transport system permease subunit
MNAVVILPVSSRIGSGQPGLGVGYELDAIAAAVFFVGVSFPEQHGSLLKFWKAVAESR